MTALVVLFVIIGAGVSNWRGSGFRAKGPELPQLRHVLALTPGMSVADVGAGNGELTVALAAEVGSSARVYSNDLDLEQVRATVAAAGLSNVTFVESQAHDTSLPENCCEAIVLRRVYHHLTDPVAINASLSAGTGHRGLARARAPSELLRSVQEDSRLAAESVKSSRCAARPSLLRLRLTPERRRLNSG